MIGDQTYSLVFQNYKEPYQANITRIAVEKEFYTDSVYVDVDEAITELERKLGRPWMILGEKRHAFELQVRRLLPL